MTFDPPIEPTLLNQIKSLQTLIKHESAQKDISNPLLS